MKNPTSTRRYLWLANVALRRAERFAHILVIRRNALAESQMYITLARASEA